MRLDRLKEVRRSRNLSQQALGRRLGWSQPRIATIEGGLSVGTATAEKLAEVLMCDVADLRTPTEPTVTFKVSELPADVLKMLTK